MTYTEVSIVKIRSAGSSAVVTLSPLALKASGLHIGDYVTITVEHDNSKSKIVIDGVKHK
jgi:antitoxin component of MazEF toxin-antitoxin module